MICRRSSINLDAALSDRVKCSQDHKPGARLPVLLYTVIDRLESYFVAEPSGKNHKVLDP